MDFSVDAILCVLRTLMLSLAHFSNGWGHFYKISIKLLCSTWGRCIANICFTQCSSWL